LAHTLASPYLGYEPKARVAIKQHSYQEDNSMVLISSDKNEDDENLPKS